MVSTPKTVLYRGPNNIGDDVSLALKILSGSVSFESSQHAEHNVICVNGLTDTQRAISATAVYLVGSVASCVDVNLKIRSALFGEDTVNRGLASDVNAKIRDSNDISTHTKSTQRDPWIWEGISHLMIHLSVFGHHSHPPDKIIAKNLPNLNVQDHGLDLIALYGSNSLGVTAGECKAYLNDPSRAITDASNRLKEIDEGLRDSELRRMLANFRSALTEAQIEMLVQSSWLRERAYFPMVCCDASYAVDWQRNRQVIRRLEPPPDRKFLVPLPIDNAGNYFDAIADAMRQYSSQCSM